MRRKNSTLTYLVTISDEFSKHEIHMASQPATMDESTPLKSTDAPTDPFRGVAKNVLEESGATLEDAKKFSLETFTAPSPPYCFPGGGEKEEGGRGEG